MISNNRRRRDDRGLARTTVVLGIAGAVLAASTAAVVLTSSGSPVAIGAGPTPTPVPTIGVALAGQRGTLVPWQHPLTFSVTDGTITSLTATDGNGAAVTGALTPTRWASSTTLVPGQTYVLHAELKDSTGKASTTDRTVQASPATNVLHATVSPAGGTFGVGQAVIIRFDKKVKGAAARKAVMAKLAVTTTPAVEGAWHWYNSYEVHYRGPAYWKPGTVITTTVDLAGLRVPGTDVWGAPEPVTRHYTIGDALIATVDINTHLMTVKRNGVLVRTMKVSTGRDEYPTKGGVHVVLVREKKHLYNSATIGIPTASPDGYYHYLPWSVRISNGGAFVHANPATVRVQGVRNVSHGCVNASIADARWYYENSKLGDIVNVVNAVVPPNKADAGMSDWNYTWAEWQAGNLGT